MVSDLVRGNQLLRSGKLEEAVDAFQKAIALHPDLHWSHYKLGEALEQLGRLEEAVVAYRKAMELRPQSIEYHYKLGYLLLESGQGTSEAIKVLKTGLKLNPNDYRYYQQLGNALVRKKKWSEAIEAYQKSVDLNPLSEECNYNLCQAHKLHEIGGDLKKYIVDGDWESSLEMAVFLWKRKIHQPIEAIIYGKLHRPKSKLDQYLILTEISKLPQIDNARKIVALIAASHKAMESMRDDLVESCIKDLKFNFSIIDKLGFSNHIRKDKTHTYFSASSVLWHMYLFVGKYDELFEVGEKSLDYFRSINESDLTEGFYSTCINVARCLAIAYLSGVKKRDIELVKISFTSIKDAFYCGILRAHAHDVKFAEYLDATRIYNEIARVHKNVIDYINDSDQVIPSMIQVIRVAMRPHEKKKVERLISNFERFWSS